MNSTFISLAKIIKSYHYFNLFIWILFNLISVLTCANFLRQVILNYLSFSVVTNIQTVYEQPMEYPGFTICDPDEINLKNFSKYFTRFEIDNNKADRFDTFSKYGPKCIQFNSGYNMRNKPTPIIYSKQGGYDDSIEMKFQIRDKISGFFVIHERDNPPRLSKDSTFSKHFYRIRNNFEFEFKIEKIKEEKLGEPYNKCLKDYTKFDKNTTLINFYKNSRLGYTQTDCLNLCFELSYINNNSCNCKTNKLNKIWGDCYVNSNTPNNVRDCTYNYRLNFFQNDVLKKCEEYCPSECDSLNYQVENSIYYREDQNYTTIKLYMKNLKYTLISQQAKMNTDDLISNIGGTISLFIGISFISLFEIFEIFFESIAFLFKRNKNQVDNVASNRQIFIKNSTIGNLAN